MRDFKFSWDALLIASVVIVAGVCSQMGQMAWADASEPQGRIVQIAPGDADLAPVTGGAIVEEEGPAESKPTYWIGIRGRSVQSPVLKTQLQLAEDVGVVVEEVINDSPAAKAGVRKHDILLRANGELIQDMKNLQSLVIAGEAKPIELRVIRLGKEETFSVIPQQQPPGQSASAGRRDGFGNDRTDELRKLLEQFGIRDGVRMFGPGVVFNNQRFDFNRIPNGVGVTIQRQNDGPAKITVKQGDKTWSFDSNDQEALKQLPDEVREYVTRLMEGGRLADGIDWQQELDQFLPDRLNGILGDESRDAQQDPIIQRMEELELRLKELQQRLDESGAP